ncbi:Ribosome assembly protein rrb1 [Tilletia horrida]|uniref:Ribosome assembly protein rrb1 n=1 Tax=Tilletia horrida TaxID=155126 RepID=A0AAN6GUL2_9BASI|nr:Ribosome assembly protein rrb1 [Tilletia horrida]
MPATTKTVAAPSPVTRKRGAEEDSTTTTQQSPAQRNGKQKQQAQDDNEDEGMGEFEDEFEDEIVMDDDDGGEVVYASDDDDDDDADPDADGDEAMIDGVPVSNKVTELNDDDDEDAEEQEAQVFIPGTHTLEDGQTLEPDQSAYEMLHRLNVTWPCLSFDILADHLGSERRRFPHTAYFVAGTQADMASKNEIMVMKASSMFRTQKDGADSEDEDDDDANSDDLDDDAILEYRSIPHTGGINRIRAALTSTPSSSALEPCLDPYPVAVWSELGKVGIYDVRPFFNALDRPAGAQALMGQDKKKAERPMFTVEAHRGVEGYAMDWAGIVGGGSSAGGGAGSGTSAGSRTGSLRLLSGDLHSKIYLTTATQTGFTTSPTAFNSHTSSVEDLQWSPAESTVFASCSADRSIRIWDVRVKSRKSVLAVEAAHEQDVNVISWNRLTDYLLLSGGDEGGLNVWDLRSMASAKPASGKAASAPAAAPTPVASFQWHTAPISSVEWHPSEDSVFAASGRDDQVTLWDLSVEHDDEEDATAGGGKVKGPGGKDVPDQLLFCHHGASEIKEVHWHQQIPGMLMSTSADGFHLFKTISV